MSVREGGLRRRIKKDGQDNVMVKRKTQSNVEQSKATVNKKREVTNKIKRRMMKEKNFPI